MESNRNLSSIISRIRDEGPPGAEQGAPEDVTAVTASVPSDDPDTRPAVVEAGRRNRRRPLLALVLPLVVITGLVVVAGYVTGFLPEGSLARPVRGWFAESSTVGADAGTTAVDTSAATAANDQQIDELRLQQAALKTRLDELAATVAALAETVTGNRADADATAAKLRRERKVAVGAIESRVAGLKRELAGVAGTSSAKTSSTGGETEKQEPPGAAAKPAGRDMASREATGEEWVVNVASSSQEQALAGLAAKLRAQGIDVERQTLTIDGNLMYRLRVPGFATSTDARRYAERLDKEHALRGAWISRR